MFLSSHQLRVATGTADERFVQALYQLLLHRTGSASEIAGWGGAFASLGRSGIALGFLKSTEYRTILFAEYYNTLLHRSGANGEISAWAISDLPSSTVRGDLEASFEFSTNG